MHTRVVTFYGGEPGYDGIPEQFHGYFVVASAIRMLGRSASVASVVPLTSAPEPPVAHFVVPEGSGTDAIEKAVAALEMLPGNQGLQKD